MEEDLISIVIPVYNMEKYLDRCLNSVVNQTYKNLEIIIVDDGSTDSSHLIYEKFQQKDDRIVIFKKENGGQGSARNFGLNHAHGKYLSFIDSDDYVSINYVFYLYKALKKYNLNIALCKVRIGKESNYVFADTDINVEVISRKNFLGKWFSREAIETTAPVNKMYGITYLKENIFYFPNIKYFEDVMFSPKVISKTDSIAVVNQILYYYYQNSQSTMHSSNNTLCKYEMFLQEYFKRMYWFKDNNYIESYKINAIKNCKYIILFYVKSNDEIFRKKIKTMFSESYKIVKLYCPNSLFILICGLFQNSPYLFIILYKISKILHLNQIIFKDTIF